ncbi:heavy metal translocating P-type ATPase, partial [Klebsiella pneumoniae]|nr:heavy metal translocating P-type ATPase [Klebsiella pneumoniae]
TGESIPRDVQINDEILSGTINLNSVIKVKVTKVFGESTISRILDMVENAVNKKAHTEKFITKFCKYYTPIVVFSAVAIAIIPPFVIKDANFSTWIYRALSFLVVSCPCALVVSVPLGLFSGIGGASRKG